MKQETHSIFSHAPPFKVSHITTTELPCPHCKNVIKFIVPDSWNGKNWQEEAMYLREQIQHLHFELTKANELIKLQRGLLPH